MGYSLRVFMEVPCYLFTFIWVSMFNKLQSFGEFFVCLFTHRTLKISLCQTPVDSKSNNTRTTWTGTSSYMMETTS